MLAVPPASPTARRPARTPQRRGFATVEFAVIATVLAILTLGMFEISRAIRAKAVLSDCARTGCRMAALPGSTTSSVTTGINAILNDNGLITSSATITLKVNDVVADASTAQQNDKIAITVAYPVNQVITGGTLYLSSKGNLTETVVMQRQR
jgi:Flp pilus assembly protein TadG